MGATRVLLIEDNAAVAASVIGALELRGYEVHHAATMESARIGLAMPRDHDVIICDYELPERPGGLKTGKGTTLIDGYTGSGYVILASGLDRRREVEQECPNRKPDAIMVKGPELINAVIDAVAAGKGGDDA